MWHIPRAVARISAAFAVAFAWGATAAADSIRIDDVWHQDVYIVEDAQFYHVLNPRDGTSISVSKKRQDISAPRLSRDEAERDKLKAAWEVASKERKAAEARDIELRVRDTNLTNRDRTAPKPERRKLSPEERAAQRAAWQAKLLERQQAMEVRQQILNERMGIVPEPAVEGELPVEGEAIAGGEVPPGPRAQPQTMPQPAGDALQQELIQQQVEEMQRLQMQPEFYNEQERIMWEMQQQQEFERMQAEAYLWQQMQAQGYLDSMGYLDSIGYMPAQPTGQNAPAPPATSHVAPGPGR